MAFLQLKSTNPNFSYLIRKNPASGLIARELRKGTLFGYYSEGDVETYNIYFRDGFNDISYPEFKDQQFEYVNATRYSSAQFILNALSDMCRDAYKKQDDVLDPSGVYTNSIIVNMIKLDGQRTLTAFLRHFPEVNIKVDDVAHKHYRLTFTTDKSLYYLLNFMVLFAAFIVTRNDTEYLFLDDVVVGKYFAALSVIDAPYFIRYNFKVELLRWLPFTKFKPILEASSRYPIEMCAGDTNQMRCDAVERELSFSNHIVDVGCGEGRYIIPFTRRMLKEKTYFAIDSNTECLKTVARKAKFKEITNVKTFESVDAFLTSELPEGKFDFILGEVIEHMPKDEAKDLIVKCLQFEHCSSIIITTPNKDFNQFFWEADEKEVRHPDHVFEFTADEFKAWVSDILPDAKWLDVGDRVSGIPVTSGAVIKRRDDHVAV